jgi:Helix-turn-helix domain
MTQAQHLLNRDQAANILGLKPQTLAVWASTQRYELPYVKVGRSVKYRLSDLEMFISDNLKGVNHG